MCSSDLLFRYSSKIYYVLLGNINETSNSLFINISDNSNNVYNNYYNKTFINTQLNNISYNQEQLNDKITLTSNTNYQFTSNTSNILFGNINVSSNSLFLNISNNSNIVYNNYYNKTFINTQLNNISYNQEQLNNRITSTSNNLIDFILYNSNTLSNNLVNLISYNSNVNSNLIRTKIGRAHV